MEAFDYCVHIAFLPKALLQVTVLMHPPPPPTPALANLRVIAYILYSLTMQTNVCLLEESSD